jgi:hypothetical protein
VRIPRKKRLWIQLWREKGRKGVSLENLVSGVCAMLAFGCPWRSLVLWHGKEKSFSPEMEKKLLVADESVSCDESQYRMLKKYSGQDEATVNQKYMKGYKVRNNMNILNLSNSERPIFVERMELPTDEKNNQFFVYAMKKFAGPVEVELPVKLKSRLGHYIRTELKNVYERAKDRTDCRYSIPVPITAEERSLFDLNKSDLDEEVDKIMDQMHGSYGESFKKFFEAGYLPKVFVANYNLPHKLSKTDIFRRLKERGYCEPSESVDDEPRPKIDGKRERCLVMTEKMKTWYAGQKELAA